ncbi:hypothetical protein ACFLYY_00815 [Patescibacteria group bacterium]
MKSFAVLKLSLIISIFFCATPCFVNASDASLSIFPQSGSFTTESTFDVSVFVNTGGNDINTIKIDLQFDPRIVRVVTPAKGLSLISEWSFPPTFSNDRGTISLEGGFPGTGINTTQGLITVIVFKAVSTGSVNLNFADSSVLLLGDARGTNVLTSFNRGSFDIVSAPPAGPQIFSETHPDQNRWYRNSNPSFSWEPLKGEEISYSYELDDDPYYEPNNTINTKLSSVSFEDVKEGVQYFHLKATKNGIWGGTSHFKIMIDKTPPSGFRPSFQKFEYTSNESLSIDFNTSDILSGMDHYEVKFANVTDSDNLTFSAWIITQSPFRMPTKNPGSYEIFVRAFDNAGNFKEEKTELKILNSSLMILGDGIRLKRIFLPWWTIYLFFAIILVAIGYGGYILLKWIKQRSENAEIHLLREIKEAEKEIGDVKIAEEKLRELRIKEEKAKDEYQRLQGNLEGEIKKDDE